MTSPPVLDRPDRGRRVVVTGVGALSPNGLGREAFWRATRDGISGVGPIRSFDAGDFPVRIAGELRDLDLSPVFPSHEARHLPRAAPLALLASAEALEDGKLDPAALDLAALRRFGVVIGSGGAGMEFMERQFREYYLGDPKAVSLYTVPSSTPGALSSEISIRHGLRGVSHVITTGCTSSTDALGRALDLIRYGRADRVLTGGADAPISPGILTGFCLMKILTTSWNDDPTRGSRPFSRDRDGFVLAEGAWILLLEELKLALARDAPIYAEVLGYASTCEAFHRVRLNESGEEPAQAMLLALADAGIGAERIDYINLHGTSTVLNDRIETRAVHLVFGDGVPVPPCSSLKSMIGHPQGASGAAGIAASLLAMRDGFIPPTINVDLPDPECDLDVVPHHGRAAVLDHVLCNCIGFGSKNAAVVLGRYAPSGA